MAAEELPPLSFATNVSSRMTRMAASHALWAGHPYERYVPTQGPEHGHRQTGGGLTLGEGVRYLGEVSASATSCPGVATPYLQHATADQP